MLGKIKKNNKEKDFHIVFVVPGAEYTTIEVLSAVLKKAGFKVSAVLDECLFDDKNYITIPWLAKLFDRSKEVIKEILNLKPDLIGFTVISPAYHWALKIAKGIKEKNEDIPIIFGGYHPTAVPEIVIKEKNVDMICIGEGEDAIVELADSLYKKTNKLNIKNIWFKDKNGKIIYNKKRKEIQDINKLPLLDKTVFEGQIPLNMEYLMLTSRGCPYGCSYCGVSFLADESKKLGCKKYREFTVDNAIEEVKYYKEKYKFKWIFYLTNVFSANKKWTLEYLKRYKEEIKLPYKICTHVSCLDEEIIKKLKETGCYMIQLGMESYSEKVRKEVLFRNETNEDYHKICKLLDKYKLKYTFDYIFGLPYQTDEEILDAIKFSLDLKYLVRLTPFWITYFPKVPMVKWLKDRNMITDEHIERIEQGLYTSCLTTGSITDKKLLRRISNYRLIFRILPATPRFIMKIILKIRIYKLFFLLPVEFLVLFIDVVVSFILWDYAAITYLRKYFWFIKKRIFKKAWNKD